MSFTKPKFSHSSQYKDSTIVGQVTPINQQHPPLRAEQEKPSSFAHDAEKTDATLAYYKWA